MLNHKRTKTINIAQSATVTRGCGSKTECGSLGALNKLQQWFECYVVCDGRTMFTTPDGHAVDNTW